MNATEISPNNPGVRNSGRGRRTKAISALASAAIGRIVNPSFRPREDHPCLRMGLSERPPAATQLKELKHAWSDATCITAAPDSRSCVQPRLNIESPRLTRLKYSLSSDQLLPKAEVLSKNTGRAPNERFLRHLWPSARPTSTPFREVRTPRKPRGVASSVQRCGVNVPRNNPSLPHLLSCLLGGNVSRMRRSMCLPDSDTATNFLH
jgi:hypothetical protein